MAHVLLRNGFERRWCAFSIAWGAALAHAATAAVVMHCRLTKPPRSVRIWTGLAYQATMSARQRPTRDNRNRRTLSNDGKMVSNSHPLARQPNWAEELEYFLSREANFSTFGLEIHSNPEAEPSRWQARWSV